MMVARIPFHGKFTVPGTDEPASGVVSFTPSVEVRDTGGKQIFVTVATSFVLDENGEIQGELYATDDPSLVPTGWSYTVSEQFTRSKSSVTSVASRVWNLVVPSNTTGTLELSDVIDAVEVPPYVVALLASNNLSDLTDVNQARANLGITGGAGVDPGDTVDAATAFGIAPHAGTGAEYSRVDHQHGTPAAPTIPGPGAVTASTSFGQAPSNGVASTFSRSDHVHGTPSAPTVPTAGSTVVAGTSFGQSSVAGSASTFSRSDHSHGTPTLPPGGVSREAAMLGLQAVTMAWSYCSPQNAPLTLPSGTVVLQLWRPGAVSVARLGTWLVNAGVTAGGVNAMGLYTAAGVLIDQTADMTALLGGSSNVHVEAALGSTQNLADATNYYVAILTHFTTSPKVAGILLNANPPSFRGGPPPSLVISGQSTLPATFDPFSATKNNGSYFMTGS